MGLSRTLLVLPFLASAGLQAAPPNDLLRNLVGLHTRTFAVDNQFLEAVPLDAAKGWSDLMALCQDYGKGVPDPSGKCAAQMGILAEAGNRLLMEKMRAYDQATKAALGPKGQAPDHRRIAWKDLQECKLQAAKAGERIKAVKDTLKGMGGGLFSSPTPAVKDALLLLNALADVLDATATSFETSYQLLATGRDAQALGEAAETANGRLQEGDNLLLKPLDAAQAEVWRKARTALVDFARRQGPDRDLEETLTALTAADEDYLRQRQTSWTGTIARSLKQDPPVGLPRIDRTKIDFARLDLAPVTAGLPSLQTAGAKARERKASMEATLAARSLRMGSGPRVALEAAIRLAGLVSMETLLYRNGAADLQQAKSAAR